MTQVKSILGGMLLVLAGTASAEDNTVIRIGMQATGTSGWELSILEQDAANSGLPFALQTQKLANPEAGKIALQSGAVDLIISDWIWVSRMRSTGADYTFYPYSAAAGGLIVAGESPIKTLADLKGKRLGIAGGELDKNWLLLKALAKRQGVDLDANVEKVFGAPPLINEQLKLGRIDAALNYWHFAARLEAQGFRQIIDGKGILQGLGIDEPIANIGYVFKQSWADAHKPALNAFLHAGALAKARLCNEDAAWQKSVMPMLKADAHDTQVKLRARYCEGITVADAETERAAAERIFGLLHELSAAKLTGTSDTIQPGTFYILD